MKSQVPLPTAAIVALQEGRKIDAIKLTREALGSAGLKEAVLLVDRHLAANPSLKMQFEAEAAKQRRNSGSLMTLAWLVLIALVVLWALQHR